VRSLEQEREALQAAELKLERKSSDMWSGEVVGTVKVDGDGEEAIIGKDGLIYLNSEDTNEVVVFDPKSLAVKKRFPIGVAQTPTGLAYDAKTNRLFIGCRKEPTVLVMDTETGKEISTVSIPGGIDDLFLDAPRKKLYASCGEGFLVVLKQTDADKLEIVEKIPTVKDARTCLYVPETQRIYLAVPRQAGKEGPEIRIYQAK